MRRAENANRRQSRLDMAAAIHESGHAVGHLLTARSMGREPNEAIEEIEVATEPSSLGVFGEIEVFVLATCWAPMFNETLQTMLEGNVDVWAEGTGGVWNAITEYGDPDDIVKSLRKRLLVHMMGPAAEARYRRQDPITVVQSIACRNDWESFARESIILGVEMEELDALLEGYLNAASMLVARPAVWEAVESIARKLKTSLSGERIAEIAWPKLQQDLVAIELAERIVTWDGVTKENALG